MKPKMQKVIELAIDEGVRTGFYRAHKHDDSPSEDAVIDAIANAVMNSFYDYFDFDDV